MEVLWDGDGGTPWKERGTSGSIMGWIWVTLLPPSVDKQTDACENITSRRTSYAGGKNQYLFTYVTIQNNYPKVQRFGMSSDMY